MNFTLKLAGYKIAVDALYESSRIYCQDYLTEEQAELLIELHESDIREEQARYPREELEQIFSDQAYIEIGSVLLSAGAYLELLVLYRRIAEKLLDKGVLLFHGSAVAVDGKVYLFTAKSGTGKSTHTALWRRLFGERAVMINDDKPLLRFDGTEVMVCGTPWDGKHRLSSARMAPLQAVCLLERGVENTISEMSPAQALGALFQQTYRPETAQGMEKTLELLGLMTERVRFYRLQCNMELSAAKIAAGGMDAL